jgi:hypothetical protein
MVPATLIRRRRTGRIASNEMCNVRISAENAGVALQDVAERAQHTDINTTASMTSYRRLRPRGGSLSSVSRTGSSARAVLSVGAPRPMKIENYCLAVAL